MVNNKILLDITIHNLLENTQTHQESCLATRLNECQLRYFEDDKTEVFLAWNHDSLSIERQGETHTKMMCKVDEKTEATISTEFGEFHFDVETEFVKSSKKMLSVQYSLFQGNQRINYVHFRWIMKEVQA